MPLPLQLDDEFLQLLLGPAPIQGKMHLHNRQPVQALGQPVIDITQMSFVQHRPLVEDIGQVPQTDLLLPGLAAEDLLGERGIARTGAG